MTYREALRSWQRGYFLTVLHDCNWSVAKAAQAVGFNRTNFYRKLQGVGIDVKRRRYSRGNAAWQELGQ